MVSPSFATYHAAKGAKGKGKTMGLGSWWDAHGVPRVIKFACGMPAIMHLRSKVVPLAEGEVFELGCGGGINQPFYRSDAINRYAGIDPGGKLLEYARTAAEKKGWQADIRDGVGEAIPFDDEASIPSCAPTPYARCRTRPKWSARCGAS
jgi:SAM-dependent methyltransferase